MKIVVMLLMFVFAAVQAKAEWCEYYQWRWKRCETKTVAQAEAPAMAPVAAKPQKNDRKNLQGVNFDTGSANIKASSYSVLDENLSHLNSLENVKITVMGFTDNVGSDVNNQKLSEARAKAVRDYFVNKGFAANNINIQGLGENDPIASNDTSDGRLENRRIEIRYDDVK